MALIATSMGWRENPETGVPEFAITLGAETEADVPMLTFGDICKSVPLRLVRKEAPPTPSSESASAARGEEG